MKNAKMEIIRFDAQDVIATSNVGPVAVTKWFQVSKDLLSEDLYPGYKYISSGDPYWDWDDGDYTYHISGAGADNTYWQLTLGESSCSSNGQWFTLSGATPLDAAGASEDELKSFQAICEFLGITFETPSKFQ